jgi:peptide/nickel transport system substrate-binding protein
MNWKDADTDEWLAKARTALTPEDRATYYGMVQERVMNEHLWMPVLNINLYQVTNRKLKGARPHMLYGNTFYKGLDASF